MFVYQRTILARPYTANTSIFQYYGHSTQIRVFIYMSMRIRTPHRNTHQTRTNRAPIATAQKTSYNDKNISFVDKKLSFLIIKLLFFDICIFFVLLFCGLLVEKMRKLWSISRKIRKNDILLLFYIFFLYLCVVVWYVPTTITQH
jgi:hypothetical protein